MTDIVERLRAAPGHEWFYGPLVDEAADEIEKLRAQVVALQSSLEAGPPRPGKKTPDAGNG